MAASPCWNMALPDVISAIFVWALGSLPRHDPTVLFVRFFPLDIGLPLGSRGSARKKFPQRSFMWGNISRLQPFVYLQAPILAWPPDCPDLLDSMPIQPPGRIHRAVLAPLPITSSGITTCPNRTIDTTGLVMFRHHSPARPQPCRLLLTPLILQTIGIFITDQGGHILFLFADLKQLNGYALLPAIW